MTDKIGVAVVGVGFVGGQAHAPSFKKIENSNLVALCRARMIEKNYLNADQVNFLGTMQTILTKKDHIEFFELYEPPFTNFGPKAPIPLFRKEELDEALKMCKSLEVEVLQHA